MSSRDPSRTSAITPLLFSLVFSSLFTWLFIRSMKWEAFENAFFHVKPLSLLLFIGLTICMISLRAFRSVLILNRLTGPRRSWVRLFSTSFIGFGAILLFPFRSGELVRPWLLASPRKSAGRRIRFSSLIGVSIFERVLDGLLVSFLLISAVSWLLLRSTAPGWVLPALLLTAGIFTT
ncbi:flippase-like domain-containing protein, partial [Myxococcota bacterium]|nr:flippase-like domain-containing protein [Myxococcota bacterium]